MRRERVLLRMAKVQRNQRRLVLASYFKRWLQTKVQYLDRIEGCKKIKSALKSIIKRRLKASFSLWKHSAQTQVHMELTKRLDQRNKILAKTLSSLYHKHMSTAYIYIHKHSKFAHILSKALTKTHRALTVDSFSLWKSQVYKRKLTKISLMVIIKEFQRHASAVKHEYFVRWKAGREKAVKEKVAYIAKVCERSTKRMVLNRVSVYS